VLAVGHKALEVGRRNLRELNPEEAVERVSKICFDVVVDKTGSEITVITDERRDPSLIILNGLNNWG